MSPQQEVPASRTLVVVVGSRAGRHFDITYGRYVIGRAATADIVLDDAGVSRKHALLMCTADTVTIEDAGSVNGTWVNGSAVNSSVVLHANDRVRIGEAVLVLEGDPSSPHRHLAAEQTAALHSVKPWYLRGKSALLGAGAVAGATLAIWGLWDKVVPATERDVADAGIIDRLENLGDTPLSDFSTENLGGNLALTPDSSADGQRGLPADTAIHFLPIRASDHEPAPSVEPSPEQSSPTPSSPASTATPSSIPNARDAFPQDHPLLRQYRLEEGDQNVIATPRLTFTPSPSANVGADESTPDDVANRLATALSYVELADGQQGGDALGWSVGVALIIEGLAHEHLVLEWSLAGPDVPDVWKEDKLAYGLTASTDRDTGNATIWVPNLASSAPYQVNVRLTYDNGDVIDQRGLSLQSE
jgi:hypothetical protein